MTERLCSLSILNTGIAVLALPGSSSATARQLLEAVRRQIISLKDTEEARGIIIVAQGDSFCRCRTEEQFDSPYMAANLASFGQQVMFDLEKIGKPCIAAVSGECTGLGLELALACDFILTARSARFGFPDISVGRIPFCGGTQRLARLVGKSRAKELIFSGDLVDASEALRIGLANRMYDDSELMPGVEKLLEKICTRSPFAIRIGGEVINAGYDIDLQTACLLERDAFALIFASHDRTEGMQAFLNKRQPEFKGK